MKIMTYNITHCEDYRIGQIDLSRPSLHQGRDGRLPLLRPPATDCRI